MTTPLEFINNHRARRAQRPLDPLASGWTDADVQAEARRLGRPPSCSVCLDTQRLINRDGDGLQPLRPGEPPGITATEMPGCRGFAVSVGEVAPCPRCWKSAHELEVAVRWATLSWSPSGRRRQRSRAELWSLQSWSPR